MTKKVIGPKIRDLFLFKDMTIYPFIRVILHLFQSAEFSLCWSSASSMYFLIQL
jgi:hypothetical protein